MTPFELNAEHQWAFEAQLSAYKRKATGLAPAEFSPPCSELPTRLYASGKECSRRTYDLERTGVKYNASRALEDFEVQGILESDLDHAACAAHFDISYTLCASIRSGKNKRYKHVYALVAPASRYPRARPERVSLELAEKVRADPLRPYRALGTKYNISAPTISNIMTGKRAQSKGRK